MSACSSDCYGRAGVNLKRVDRMEGVKAYRFSRVQEVIIQIECSLIGALSVVL